MYPAPQMAGRRTTRRASVERRGSVDSDDVPLFTGPHHSSASSTPRRSQLLSQLRRVRAAAVLASWLHS